MRMTTPEVETVIQELKKRLAHHEAPAGVLKFDFADKGAILIDRAAADPVRLDDGSHADCILTLSFETFLRLAKGEIDPTSAFMQGKLRVAGKMDLAMKLGPLLKRAAG
jgi:putative sterol carrier protein